MPVNNQQLFTEHLLAIEHRETQYTILSFDSLSAFICFKLFPHILR